jgi:hypothetical protein
LINYLVILPGVAAENRYNPSVGKAYPAFAGV